MLLGFFSVTNSSSQNIIGLWQRDSNIVGSGTNETYHFFENGKFEFCVSQYLYLNTIISFQGIYKINNDQICFVIKSRKEIVGGQIEQGSLGFQDNWVISGSTIKEIKQDSIPYNFNFSIEVKEKKTVLQIGNTTYYKVLSFDVK